MPAQQVMPHEGVTVRWTRAIAYGKPIDRWFATVCSPRETEGFAQIERVNGEWWLIVFPPWSVQRQPEFKTKRVHYLRAKTARKHLEAWARANWAVLEHAVCLRTDQNAPTR